jgi:hypothetical protein
MKKHLLFMLLVFLSTQFSAQSNWNRFWKESGPIKKWVVLHPFKANKALKISMEANRVSDSIAKTPLLDSDIAGGQVDAFRHAYWMARLHQEIGKCAARSLGKAHERANYRAFKKYQFENDIFPDKASREMDLFNNKSGLSFTKKGVFRSKNGLMYKIANAILKGDLKIIKKDTSGNYLTCDNKIIPPEELLHVWENGKCIVASNSSRLRSN